MVRRKTQKAGSLLNMFRKKPNVQQPVANQPKPVKNETYANALKRNYVFFHYKLQGQEPPKNIRFVTPEQEAEVRRILIKAKQEGKDQDEIIRDIFKADPVQFQSEFVNWEQYAPTYFLNQGTEYERRAFPISSSLDRFISTIRNTPERLQYKSDFMVHICTSNNFSEPVTSLSDEYCVAVLTPEMRQQYNENRKDGYAVSYIIIKPQFFPPRVTTFGGPINLTAGRIPVISFLLDAFREKGIVEIEPTLYKTLEREAPELLRFSVQEPVVLVTPDYLSNSSTTRDQYIVVDASILPRGRNTVNMKNFPSRPILKEAFTQKKVYFMDPKTLYEVRTYHPELWATNFGAKYADIYKSLTPAEKVAFCFLQFKKLEEFYTLSSTLNSLKQARQEVFESNNLYELADNFEIEDEENLRQLVKLQDSLIGTVEIRSPEDVRRLLSKFDPRIKVSAKAPIQEVVYPPELLAQRAPLLKAYQNALLAPRGNTSIKGFFKTRKAKQKNNNNWVERVLTAKRALLNFDRTHNLPFSKGAEQYPL